MKTSRLVRTTQIGDRITIQTDAKRAEAILLVLSGCTLTEVGKRFGLTRERVRQYMRDAGLTSQARQRFADGGTQGTVQFLTARANRIERYRRIYEKRQARIRHAVEVLRSFNATHGRAPTHSELALVLLNRGDGRWKGNNIVVLIGHLTSYKRQRRHMGRRLAALYRIAGLKPYSRGVLSHLPGCLCGKHKERAA